MITPVLEVRTEPIDDAGDLLLHAEPGDPLVFLRGTDGLVGRGEALRLVFSGPHRIAEAAAAWRAVGAAAHVDDTVRLPGTGLVAFGSLAFADESAAESVLIVPSVIIGRRDGVAWMTRVEPSSRVELVETSPPPTSSRVELVETSPPPTSQRVELVETSPPPTPLGPPWTVALEPGVMTPERYHAAVTAAVAALEHHELEKVVLARDLVGVLPPGVDVRRPLDALHAAYPDTFTFAVAGLIGASPETLVRSDRGQLSARVLAGSARPEATGLLESAKNRDEHDFAVHSVLDGLRPHTMTLEASEPFVLSLPNLTHLATDVTGTLSDASSALDLVGALHPTAAVAGIPTAAALDLIARLEAVDRGRYAGPVGWIDGNGDGEWAIALRCAQLGDGRVTAYAGAGIVAASDPTTELAETDLKFAPIRAALQ